MKRDASNMRAHEAPVWILRNNIDCLPVLVQYFDLKTVPFEFVGDYLRNRKTFEHEATLG
jgi:hypothetical protein